MSTTTSDQLRALTPRIYLAAGFVNAEGAPRRILLGEAASAAATQLLAAALSPQELGFTVDALILLLEPLADGSAPARLQAALEETVSLVARTIGQANNAGLWEWLNACADRVGSDDDLAAFLAHLKVVQRLYAMLVATQPEPPAP